MDESNRRGGPRLDLRLRVRFLDDEQRPEAEATDISPGGARIESRVPIEPDSTLRMLLDAGDGEPVEAEATVAWCRPRKGVSLRKIYDVGVRFDSEWLSNKRGKLGRALGRIFSFGDFEPARAYDRVMVTLRAESVASKDLQLTVVDISDGGMQLRCEEPLGDRLRMEATVIIEIPQGEDTCSLEGEIVWVAEQDQGDHALSSSFGVRFSDLQDSERQVLTQLMNGDLVPPSISIFLPG